MPPVLQRQPTQNFLRFITAETHPLGAQWELLGTSRNRCLLQQNRHKALSLPHRILHMTSIHQFDYQRTAPPSHQRPPLGPLFLSNDAFPVAPPASPSRLGDCSSPPPRSKAVFATFLHFFSPDRTFYIVPSAVCDPSVPLGST